MAKVFVSIFLTNKKSESTFITFAFIFFYRFGILI